MRRGLTSVFMSVKVASSLITGYVYSTGVTAVLPLFEADIGVSLVINIKVFAHVRINALVLKHCIVC